MQNTLSQTQCFVQVEPHLKSGTQTVGELGPDVLGNLNPGQQAVSSLSVAGEPSLAGVAYDGYVVHVEVFDCGGPGPVPHAGGEGAEGSGGEGTLAAKDMVPVVKARAVRAERPAARRAAAPPWRLTIPSTRFAAAPASS